MRVFLVRWIICAFLPISLSSAESRDGTYSVTAETLNSGGASFSSSYANFANTEPISGNSSITIPEGPLVTAFHGFIGQLSEPLFAIGDLALIFVPASSESLTTNQFNYSLIVINQSTETSVNIVLTIALSENLSLIAATGALSSFSDSDGLHLVLESLPGNGSTKIEISVQLEPSAAAVVQASIKATVRSAMIDLNPSNNSVE